MGRDRAKQCYPAHKRVARLFVLEWAPGRLEGRSRYSIGVEMRRALGVVRIKGASVPEREQPEAVKNLYDGASRGARNVPPRA
jgi:hypothetical protein